MSRDPCSEEAKRFDDNTAHWHRCRIPSDYAVTNKSHPLCEWIPTPESVRPDEATLRRKHESIQIIERGFKDYRDYVLITMFGCPYQVNTTEPQYDDFGKKYINMRDPNFRLPQHSVFLKNEFPYMVPEQTHHYVWWTMASEQPTDEAITESITIHLTALLTPSFSSSSPLSISASASASGFSTPKPSSASTSSTSSASSPSTPSASSACSSSTSSTDVITTTALPPSSQQQQSQHEGREIPFDFVWVINPKMTIPEVFHVHVFWTIRMDFKLPQEEIHAAIGSIETSRKGELSNAEELVHEFFCCHGGRLERIVSTGQSSPVDFWYDQPEHEWVTIVQGNAVVNVDGEDIHMVAGDQLWIPAHTKHRVTSTSTKEQTTWMCFFFDPTSPAFTNVRTTYIGYPDCAGEESKHQCPDMRRHFSTQVHAAMKEWITAADNMMAAYHTDTVSTLLLQALSSDGATPVQASPVCTSFLAVLQTLLSNGADSTVGQSPVKALKSLFLESNSTSRKKLLRLFDFCFLNPSFRHEEQNLPIISDMIRFVSVLYSVTLFNAVGGNADVVGTLSGQ